MKGKHRLRSIFGGFVVLVITALVVSQVWASIFDNDGKPLTTLSPRGQYAQTIQNLVSPVFIIAGVILVLVMGAVLYIAFRFRERPDEDEIPAQLHGNTVLEIGWTLAPAAILLVVAVLTVATIADLEAREPDAMKVQVEGQQWWWAFRYDLNDDGVYDDPENDLITATELVIPEDTVVEIYTTGNDVIHSYWIPELNGKKDAVPGMRNFWKIQADEPGVYRGQCTEFCGLSHANMRMLVRALPRAEYNAWLANQLEPAVEPEEGSLAAEGKDVYLNQLCSSCHLIRGVNDEKVADPESGVESLLVSGIAPDLTHFSSRGTFAGSIFNSHYPDKPGATPEEVAACRAGENVAQNCGDPEDEALPGNPANPAYNVDLEDWLRDPTVMKPMAADDGRGMPNLGLGEDQIDALVAYLNSLK